MKLSISVLILLLLCACSTNRQVPTWAMQHPSDPMFYSAVVSESKARPNYQELARDKALRDIAMQISTQIDASISVSEREAWGIASSEYLSTLQATSSASIRDLQLRDSFETDKMYYAWYRLNKAEYEAQRRLLRDRALASSVDLLNRYHGAASDPATAIPLLLQALENLVDYLDMDLSYPNGAESINVYNEVLSTLRSIPAAMDIRFTPSRMPAMARLGIAQTASGQVLFNEKNARNIPLKFAFEIADGELKPTSMTDAMGVFELQINRLNSTQSPQRVKAELDQSAFANSIKKPAVAKIWQGISFSPAYLVLDVKKPQIYLDYSYIGSYQSGLRDALANQLATMQLDLANKLEDAQYLLEVRIFAKRGDHLPNLNYYTAFGDIHLTLKNPVSGATVNYLERLNLKSGGNSRANAERAVEQDAVKAINEGMLYRLLYDAILK